MVRPSCLVLAAAAPGPALAVTEGDTGFHFVDATECFAKDARPVSTRELYLSPGAPMHGGGTSRDRPSGDMAAILCNLSPGQHVHLSPGIYTQSALLSGFGAGSAPIRITGEPGAVLDGGGRRTFGLAIVESRNISVETLSFRRFTDEGLFVALSRNMTVTGNVFAQNGFASVEPDATGEGFGVHVSDVTGLVMTGNQAWGNGPTEAARRAGVLGTGIDLYNVRDALVAGSRSHHNTGGGILVEDGVNIRIRDNEIDHNELDAGGDYWDAGLWIDGGHHVVAAANRIYNNRGPAIQVSDVITHPPCARPWAQSASTPSNICCCAGWNDARRGWIWMFIRSCPEPTSPQRRRHPT
ncbi:MAG: hypothetical protein GY717_09760 [Rhodobacteraceae bacterium]|nr:hypothetical protein [Paracoccaceae bacterium]